MNLWNNVLLLCCCTFYAFLHILLFSIYQRWWGSPYGIVIWFCISKQFNLHALTQHSLMHFNMVSWEVFTVLSLNPGKDMVRNMYYNEEATWKDLLTKKYDSPFNKFWYLFHWKLILMLYIQKHVTNSRKFIKKMNSYYI